MEENMSHCQTQSSSTFRELEKHIQGKYKSKTMNDKEASIREGYLKNNFQKELNSHHLRPRPSLRRKSIDYVLNAMSNLGLYKSKNDRHAKNADAQSRRSSSPGYVCSTKNRSPSPGICSVEKKAFRDRAYSLPLRFHGRNAKASSRRLSDWPAPNSPSLVEQRFLNLPESADYHKIRSFGVDEDGNIVERGFCYVHRSENSLSELFPPSDTTLSASHSAVLENVSECEQDPSLCHETSDRRMLNIFIIGADEVGKKSLIKELIKAANMNNQDSSTESENSTENVVPILVEGNEFHLNFSEKNMALINEIPRCVKNEHTAIIIMYDVTNSSSFSSAADALYAMTSKLNDLDKEATLPILLIGNKIDLERHRTIEFSEGKELARSYNISFLEVSVILGHQVEEILKVLLNSLGPSQKIRRIRSCRKSKKRWRPKNVLLLSMDMLVIGQINSWPAKEDTLREEASIYLKSLLLKSLLMKPWKNQAGVNFINQKYLMVKRIAKPLTRTRSLCPPIVCNVDWRPT
ncbi:GTP-binding protein Rheb [Trichinella pseudospiralis]|uniref:GTP-binding protein Rheb n=1 Tax=Trichinella pseudospiralis TaxID=6337 RepID=A0A0V0YG56_TRIPS|nr:GTP-binding protein Rheb [Trichinella pseudospiralis]